MPNSPFPSAAAAWFWTVATLDRRNGGRRPCPGPGPCPPEAVLRCLDSLYRNRRIELAHGHVLRIWGRRGRPPNARNPGDASHLRLWREAMEGLDAKLRRAGIVADAAPVAVPDVVPPAVPLAWGESTADTAAGAVRRSASPEAAPVHRPQQRPIGGGPFPRHAAPGSRDAGLHDAVRHPR